MNDVVQLLVFRHGETDWNLNKKFQGHTNIPLNQKGRDQALSLKEKLTSMMIDACLCSDLDRAVETARIALSSHTIPFLFSSALRETHLGDVEGQSQIQIIEKYGEELLTKWRSVKIEDLTMGFPNGETKQQHLGRVKSYVEKTLIENPHFKRVAVSTHGGSLVRLVHAAEKAPEQAIAIPNCCLYELSFDRKNQAWSYTGYHE
ncbi:MAG: histidine phosphatase family protein [Bdellovibrionaceae bacterium]|nr:histidine phosphatase family protein [Pseudobdellovibrionaceae bacterium]